MVNIVIPMAGAGSRFSKAGYQKPKPFIDVLGTSMIEHVMASIDIKPAHFILIAREEHIAVEKDAISKIQDSFHTTIIPIAELTDGAACTVLFANKLISNDTPLLIINSDQVVDHSLQSYLDDCKNRRLDGSILTFREPSRDPKWSYAKCNPEGLVIDVKEKVAISDEATVGAYFFSQGRIFTDSAIDMIIRRDRSNNEFYVAPVYNYAIKNGAKIGTYCIESSCMHGIGTPEDLNTYLEFRKSCSQ